MKYKWVQQLSGEDCAAASLAIVCRHYGKIFRINRIREIIGTGESGTTLLGLKRGADELGFEAQGIKANYELLNELETVTLPMILYWKGYHFVVFYGKKGDRYVISDPALGVRYLTRQDLLKGWQGCLALLLTPTKSFFAQSEDQLDNPFQSLVKHLYPHRNLIFKLVLLNLLLGILALANPLLLQFLTDEVLGRKQAELLTTVALEVIILALIGATISWLQSNLVAFFAEKLQQGLKLDFGLQILHLPISYHEARREGTAIRRLSDIEQINLLVSQLVIDLPIKAFTGIVAAGFIFVYSPSLALFVLATGGAITLLTIILQPMIRQSTYRAFTVAGENAGLLSEAFRGALTLKSIVAAPQLWQEIQSRLQQELGMNLKNLKIQIINTTTANFMGNVGTILLLWYGSNLVLSNRLSIGQLLAIYGLKESFLLFVTTLVVTLVNFTRVRTITQMLSELFEYTPENQGDSVKIPLIIQDSDDISCNSVVFQYPGRRRLLNQLSLTIPGGKVTALIGKSGCGKSTLAKLLVGLYGLSEGEILLGSHTLADFSLQCLRRQVALVPQDAFFFRRSIFDNFRLGCNFPVTLEEVRAVCHCVGADEFIRQFPEQYNTILGAVAANISGGQKQRLAIARAMLNNPPILILDESTANLDPISEREILTSLLSEREEKTTILISHRPRVIGMANWVIVLNQGELEFQGSMSDFRQLGGETKEFLEP